MGGAEHLVNMLAAAKDDKTRKEALKALAALAASDEAANALSHARAISVIRSAPDSIEDSEIQTLQDETTNTAGRLLLGGGSVAINDYDGPTANPGHEPPRLKDVAGAAPRGRKDPQNPKYP